MVYKELWGKIGPEAPLIETALHTFVHVEQPGKIGQHIEIATANLDDGEKEVIGLGTSLQEEVVLVMDDQAVAESQRNWASLLSGAQVCCY